MCGRYFVDEEDQPEELYLLMAELQRRGGNTMKRGEIFPSETAPVIASNRAGRPTPFTMRWGFACGGGLIINARSETAAAKPLFRDGMARRRCLIPASYYFEWEKREKEKVRYAIGAGRMIYMAGLYRLAESGPEFTILTREPAPGIAFIHNRMPVILPPETHAAWLCPEQGPGEALRAAVLDVRFKIA